MPERLLNQECCSQIGGIWTNGIITIIDGNNTYTINDTKGQNLAQSLGQQYYCSSCSNSLKIFNGQVTINPNGMLSEICCEDYGYNYSTTDGKCYTCPLLNQITIGYDSEIPPTNIYPYGEVYSVEYLQINGENLSSACCQKYFQTEKEGYYLPYSANFGYVNPPDPNITDTNGNGFRCYKCPPSTEISSEAGFNFNINNTILNGTYRELQFLNNSIESQNCCLKVKLLSGFPTIFENGKCYIENFN